MPGDWDGGWRRTPAPALTVARAPLGVSDGLAFRSSLASWQNPALGTGLGHALLPSAPVGLAHGIAGPALPRAVHADGGPLLLRAARPQAEAGTATSSGEAPAPQTPRAPRGRSAGATPTTPTADGSGPVRRAGGGSRTPAGADAVNTPAAQGRTDTRGAGTASSRNAPASARPSGAADGGGTAVAPVARRSAAVAPDRAAATAGPRPPLAAPTPLVQRAPAGSAGRTARADGTGRPLAEPEIPPVRRVAVVPNGPRRAPAPGTTALSPSPARGRAAAPGGIGGGTPAANEPAVEDGEGLRDGHAVTVRPRPLGPPLTVARRATGRASRRLAALRPEAVRGTVTDAVLEGGRGGTAYAAQSRAAGPGPRPTAAAAGAPPAASPVQRAAAPDRTDGRGPLGAPLKALPATAEPLTPMTPEASGPAAGARPAAGPVLPVVQRRPDSPAAPPVPHEGDPAAPASHGAVPPPAAQSAPGRGVARSGPGGARARGGLGAPLPALPPTADVLRAAARAPRTPGAVDDRGAPGGRPDVRDTPGAPAVRPARVNRGSGSGTPERPSGTGTAPLLGAVPAVQRSPAAGSPAGAGDAVPARGAAGPPPDTGAAGAAPLVTRGGARSAPPAEAAPGSAPRVSAAVHRPAVQRAPDGSPGGGAAVGDAPTPARSPARGRVRDGARAPGPASGTRAAGPVAGSRSAPGPVAVARAVTGPGGMRGHGPVAVREPLTTGRPAAPSGPAAPHVVPLLAARPLAVRTRVPEDTRSPSAEGGARRPVVAASWPRGTDQAPGARDTPVTGAATGPARDGHATAPRVWPSPAVAASSGANAPPSGTSGPPRPGGTVPVVRPHPLVQRAAAGGEATARPQALPVAGPSGAPLQDRASAPAVPGPPVPVVRTAAVGSAAPGPAVGAAVPVVQRHRSGAGADAAPAALPAGVPGTAVPAQGRQRQTSAPPAPAPAATPDAGADLDDLARRLLDPMARLLRADLRRGRERAGRPHDGRR
ncbi:hypothetical protein JS756_26580 [Streptomyces actuosus]|uniref:Syndecan 1 n=1 Tax=Streptomyces actuosus TaxID=1885 RepID=A0ABS2VX51_STRAS|nr:hypothetical protein [Streptomyces actuosus]MBN0047609.1 hypothetical protein [Streptomyces actuosus]